MANDRGMAVAARKTWRTLEPLHGMIYFAPEAPARYSALGLGHGRSGYFASRSAALGRVPAEVVIATFFNFEPGLVRRALDGVWERTEPAAVLAARLEAADAALRRILGDVVGSAEVAEAAALARRATERATADVVGRPLFAAHAALAWPTEPHLVLWHAQTLLREHRGDGHVAALVAEGLSGVEALVSHAASGEVPAEVLRSTRAWSPTAWSAAVEALQHRGLLERGEHLVFTAEGAAQRQRIEERTDAGSGPAYAVLGEEGCRRLRELARPLSLAVVEAGGLSPAG